MRSTGYRRVRAVRAQLLAHAPESKWFTGHQRDRSRRACLRDCAGLPGWQSLPGGVRSGPAGSVNARSITTVTPTTRSSSCASTNFSAAPPRPSCRRAGRRRCRRGPGRASGDHLDSESTSCSSSSSSIMLTAALEPHSRPSSSQPLTVDREVIRSVSNELVARCWPRFPAPDLEVPALPYRFDLRWHLGQKWLERFMNFSRTIGVPHLGQGKPVLPYEHSSLAK